MADKRITGLNALVPGDVEDTTVFECETPGLAAPESRKITWAQLKSLLEAAAAPSRVPFVYLASGAHVVSAGVTKVDIEVLGGGEGASTDGGIAYTGAGGGYAMACNVAVAPADSLAVTVGIGGLWSDPSDAPTQLGGTSKVAAAGPVTLCEASGGGGPASRNGGEGILGDIKLTGGFGYQVFTGVGQRGGGGAGPYASPGEYQDNNQVDGHYGGGGGSDFTGGDFEADGWHGIVVIWEYQ